MGKFLAYLGHINIDITLKVPRIPGEGSVDVSADTQVNGGTLGNFCYVASHLGFDFDPYASVASSTHAAYLEDLKRLGLSTEHIEVTSDGRGPVCYIASDGSKQAAFLSQGPMGNWKPSRSFEYSPGYEYVHFSTGPSKEYLAIARNIRSSKIVFDPSQEFYKYTEKELAEFVKLSSIVLCNEYESRYILPIVGQNPSCSVIITRGKEGVDLLAEGRTDSFSSIVRNDAYDTIGAGDAFRAGMYAALFHKHNIRDSVRAGIVTASLAVARPIPDFSSQWADINDKLGLVKLRS